MTAEIEIYRDEHRQLIRSGKENSKKSNVGLKLEQKQLNKKNRQTFVKEWEDRFDVSLNPGFGVKNLN